MCHRLKQSLTFRCPSKCATDCMPCSMIRIFPFARHNKHECIERNEMAKISPCKDIFYISSINLIEQDSVKHNKDLISSLFVMV